MAKKQVVKKQTTKQETDTGRLHVEDYEARAIADEILKKDPNSRSLTQVVLNALRCYRKEINRLGLTAWVSEQLEAWSTGAGDLEKILAEYQQKRAAIDAERGAEDRAD